MIKQIKTNKKKGFTLIELIVVMAVIGILVLLAVPKFLGYTKDAQFTKHISNAKVLEEASNRYYIDHGKWPRGADEEAYTAEQVDAYAERIYDFTGKEIVLEEGNYWDIDYDTLSTYAKLPDESEQANYVLRNPAGKVYYLEGLTETGVDRLPIPGDSNDEAPVEPNEPAIPDYYVQAADADFTKDSEGNWRYTGTDDYVILPHEINGVPGTSYRYMFRGTPYLGVAAAHPVKGVVSTNPNVTDMSHMFSGSKATTLDLSSFNTANVTDMGYMFNNSQATTLDLSSFNTANVTNMYAMFQNSKATSLDLSNFNTANVTDMSAMFWGSQATTLDLSSFNTENVTNMYYMFQTSQATTLDLSSFDTANVTNMQAMFWNSQATTLDLSSFNTAKVTDMSWMFSGSQATTLDLSSFNTANVTNMRYMFYVSQASSLDLSSFNTANVTDMLAMFSSSQATTLDLSSFNTAKVTDMNKMFDGSQATTLDLSSFDTAKVTDMRYMFQSSKATTLDLSSFDLRNIVMGTTSPTSMNWNMFASAAARIGYARTPTDRAKLNNTYTYRPRVLTFIVKQ